MYKEIILNEFPNFISCISHNMSQQFSIHFNEWTNEWTETTQWCHNDIYIYKYMKYYVLMVWEDKNIFVLQTF